MIDLEFSRSGWRGMSAREKEVVDKWRIYADHLNQGGVEDNNEARAQVWFERGDELFTDLLEALARALGYSFDRVQLRRGIYRPRGHNEQELMQQTIQRALARVLTGDAPLSMKVIDFPTSDEAIKLQTEVYERMREALAEEGAVKVKTVA